MIVPIKSTSSHLESSQQQNATKIRPTVAHPLAHRKPKENREKEKMIMHKTHNS